MTKDKDFAKIDEVEVDELSDEDLEDAAGGAVEGSSGLLCCSVFSCEDTSEGGETIA